MISFWAERIARTLTDLTVNLSVHSCAQSLLRQLDN